MSNNSEVSVKFTVLFGDFISALNQATSTLQSSVSQMQSTLGGMQQSVKGLEGTLNSTGKATQDFGSKQESLGSQLTAVAGRIASYWAAWKLGDTIKEMALLNARHETLGVVMEIVGRNAGYSGAQINQYAESVRKMGITMVESRQTVISLAQANIDLSSASSLARVAQDAAVIGGVNSSEALGRIVYGIKSAQVEVLRTIGLNVSFEDSYKKLATELNRTTASLTETEKAQARTNAVFAAGEQITGSYEAAMGTAGKQITSVARYIEDYKVVMGETFNDALVIGVQAVTDHYKDLNAESKKLSEEGDLREWGRSIVNVMAFVGDAFVLAKDFVISFQEAIGSLEVSIVNYARILAVVFDPSKYGKKGGDEIKQILREEAANNADYEARLEARLQKKQLSTRADEYFEGKDKTVAGPKGGLTYNNKGDASAQKALENEIKDMQAEINGAKPKPKNQEKDKPATSASILSGWKAELQAKRDAESAFQSLSKEDEASFWNAKVLIAKKGSTEQKAAQHEAAAAGKAIQLADSAAYVENLEFEKTQYKNNLYEQLAIAQKIAEEKKKFGESSAQYRTAQNEIINIQRQLAEQDIQIQRDLVAQKKSLALGAVDERQKDAELQLQLGEITNAELIEKERVFAEEKYNIKRQALTTLQELEAESPSSNPEKLRELHAEIEALEVEHQDRLAEIKRKAALEDKKDILAFRDSLAGGFQSVIAQFLKGTLTIKGLFQGLFKSIISSFAEFLARKAAMWLANNILEALGYKVTAQAGISAASGLAGANAVASWALAPWPINIGAPAFGLAMAAAAGSFGVAASAEGGYDIPAGVNPVTQLHAREMVLPEAQADAVRGLADGDGSGGITVNYHDNSGRLSASDIERNASTIVRVLKGQARNFAS